MARVPMNTGSDREKPGKGSVMAGGDGNRLKAAVDGLHAQHPICYDDLGPHQGKTVNIRHMKLGGMTPTKSALKK